MLIGQVDLMKNTPQLTLIGVFVSVSEKISIMLQRGLTLINVTFVYKMNLD